MLRVHCLKMRLTRPLEPNIGMYAVMCPTVVLSYYGQFIVRAWSWIYALQKVAFIASKFKQGADHFAKMQPHVFCPYLFANASGEWMPLPLFVKTVAIWGHSFVKLCPEKQPKSLGAFSTRPAKKSSELAIYRPNNSQLKTFVDQLISYSSDIASSWFCGTN